MPKITFIDHSGQATIVDIAEGMSLMEGARNAGIAGIAADCGGACACATCHVYVEDKWLDQIKPRQDDEDDMLDFAAAETDHRSRLSCQITITANHEGLIVHTPVTQG